MHYLCHYCNKSTFQQFYVKCCKRKCSKLFCLDCILLKFDKDFKPEKVRRETWICYACGQKCDCIFCDPKGLKRSVCNPSQTSLKLRVPGKFKWYHEKNRGALKTMAIDCLKPLNTVPQIQEINNAELNDEKDSCGSPIEKEVTTKLEKRKQKQDLSKAENKYLKKKRALRECSENSEQDVVEHTLDDSKQEKIAKLLRTIDLEETEVEILEAESELGLKI